MPTPDPDVVTDQPEHIRVVVRFRPLSLKETLDGHLGAWRVGQGTVQLSEEAGQLRAELASTSLWPDERPFRPAGELVCGISVIANTEGRRQSVSSGRPRDPLVGQIWQFDDSFGEAATTAEVYSTLANGATGRLLEGISGCLMAYGPTGSGKTFSVLGNDSSTGILPRLADEVFAEIQRGGRNPGQGETLRGVSGRGSDGLCCQNFGASVDGDFLVRVSYLEVYCERVTDLLAKALGSGAMVEDGGLAVREHPESGFYVQGLHEQIVTCGAEVRHLLRRANGNRQVAATTANEAASRSHVVFTFIVESCEALGSSAVTQDFTDQTVECEEPPVALTRLAKLNVVDLAGMERTMDHTTHLRIKEGRNINRSNFILSEVIQKLAERQQQLAEFPSCRSSETPRHIPYRESKLTKILRSGLGGNAITSMLICLSPSLAVVEAAAMALRFAAKARSVSSVVRPTLVSHTHSVILQQKLTIESLREQLAEVQAEQTRFQQLLPSTSMLLPGSDVPLATPQRARRQNMTCADGETIGSHEDVEGNGESPLNASPSTPLVGGSAPGRLWPQCSSPLAGRRLRQQEMSLIRRLHCSSRAILRRGEVLESQNEEDIQNTFEDDSIVDDGAPPVLIEPASAYSQENESQPARSIAVVMASFSVAAATRHLEVQAKLTCCEAALREEAESNEQLKARLAASEASEVSEAECAFSMKKTKASREEALRIARSELKRTREALLQHEGEASKASRARSASRNILGNITNCTSSGTIREIRQRVCRQVLHTTDVTLKPAVAVAEKQPPIVWHARFESECNAAEILRQQLHVAHERQELCEQRSLECEQRLVFEMEQHRLGGLCREAALRSEHVEEGKKLERSAEDLEHLRVERAGARHEEYEKAVVAQRAVASVEASESLIASELSSAQLELVRLRSSIDLRLADVARETADAHFETSIAVSQSMDACVEQAALRRLVLQEEVNSQEKQQRLEDSWRERMSEHSRWQLQRMETADARQYACETEFRQELQQTLSEQHLAYSQAQAASRRELDATWGDRLVAVECAEEAREAELLHELCAARGSRLRASDHLQHYIEKLRFLDEYDSRTVPATIVGDVAGELPTQYSAARPRGGLSRPSSSSSLRAAALRTRTASPQQGSKATYANHMRRYTSRVQIGGKS